MIMPPYFTTFLVDLKDVKTSSDTTLVNKKVLVKLADPNSTHMPVFLSIKIVKHNMFKEYSSL